MKESLSDTHILSYFLKGDKAVEEKVKIYLNLHGRITISNLTYYEILSGLEYKEAYKQIQKFEQFMQKCTILNLTFTSLKISAKTFGDLKRKGITIGTADLLITGIAIEHQLQLITNNEPIQGLEIDNWKKEL